MSKLESIQIEYLKDEKFLQEYLNKIINETIHPNNRTDIDSNNKDMPNPHTLEDAYNALVLLLNNPLTEKIIIESANTINAHSMFISNGYRTIPKEVELNKDLKIEESQNISNRMQELLNKYYGDWSKLDIFKREALFSIDFIKIHPFEDGNGRTSRLLLISNLLKLGYAPAIISSESKKECIKKITTNDIDGLAEFLKEQSQKESISLNKLINSYKKNHKRP